MWGNKANGFRGSYGIVTAMFVAAMVGAAVMRQILVHLNKQLDAGAKAWETQHDVKEKTQQMSRMEESAEAVDARTFRYVI